MSTLNHYRDKAYSIAKAHGFHEAPIENIGEKLMLVVSELGEALEADRKGSKANLEFFKERLEQLNNSHNGELTEEVRNENFNKVFKTYIKDTFEDEIADSIIRLFDLCGSLGIDLETHVGLKMKYNEGRGYKHGKLY